MAHGPRKKALEFGGNPNHVTLGLELGFRGFGYGEVNSRVIYPQHWLIIMPRLFNSNSFAQSAALRFTGSILFCY